MRFVGGRLPERKHERTQPRDVLLLRNVGQLRANAEQRVEQRRLGHHHVRRLMREHLRDQFGLCSGQLLPVDVLRRSKRRRRFVFG